MFDEIKDFIKAQTNNSDNYDEKNMKSELIQMMIYL